MVERLGMGCVGGMGVIFAVATLAAPAAAQGPVVTNASIANLGSDSGPEAEIAALKATLAAVQARLARLEAQVAADAPTGARAQAGIQTLPQAAPVAIASGPQATGPGEGLPRSRAPRRDTIGDEQTGVARQETQAPPNDPDLKGFLPIPGGQTMVRLGGFAKVNAIYDTAPAGNPDKLVTSSIPMSGGRARNANLDANATRFSFEVRRPTTRGPLRFYLENDFYGGAGVTAFRLRQAHGQVGNTYAGYGYSAFTDSDAFPETLDDEGPGGEVLLRLAAIRHIFRLGDGITGTVSVEDPSSDLQLSGGRVAAQGAPDLVGAWRTERSWGHVQVGALLRDVGYGQAETDRHALGYGLNGSGLFKVGGDFLTVGLAGGEGVSRYFNDLGGKGYDAVVTASGAVRPLRVVGGHLGYTHHWNDRWRSTLVGGAVSLERDARLADTDFRASQYGALNVIWASTPSFSIGVEALYGRREQQDGRSADVVRLQTSLKYDFVR